MQTCPKNAHTGTGPTKLVKGPVSANNLIAENNPKTLSASSGVACKIENILAPSVVIKPENREKTSVDSNTTNLHDLYQPRKSVKILDAPESRGSSSTGSQIPPTGQHEAVQPTETFLNNSSDNVNFSLRKQPRVGKSMERERQQQQHITMSGGYQTTLDHSEIVALDMPHFKQEFAVKKEGDVKKEKDCDEIDMGYRNINPIENVKLERPEAKHESFSPQVAPKQVESNAVAEAITVNLINESGDECLDFSTKRKLNDSCSDDVIELSDNSTVDPPTTSSAMLKRRKLLEKPVCTPKKSPPNSYKSLIKAAMPVNTYPSCSTSKSKLITSSFNRLGNKSCINRRSILKSKTSLKKMRLAAKAKKKTQNKNVVENESVTSESTNVATMLDTTKAAAEISSDDIEKCDDNVEETSTENENNEEKSMDGSSEYSGKSNIDLTIDRVAKGYFSESDIFSVLSKQRKTKSQKKFAATLFNSNGKNKKKNKTSVSEATVNEKPKKKANVNKEAVDKKRDLAGDNEVAKSKKAKKSKLETEKLEKVKKKPMKKAEVIEKDPLALDDVPSSHSTPKRKPKAPKNVDKKTKKPKVVEVIEKVIEPVVESEDDTTVVETIEPRDDETSTTVLSSTQTINTTKSLLDETDVANNNNECFEDNNKQKQEALTLYKTPGLGWTTFNKTGKRGKRAKFGNRKRHKFTLLNDIVIPKSTSIPRWSNGWVWEGEPYQALVFLNVS